MRILDELRRDHALLAVCPKCEASFRLSDAQLFDAMSKLPPAAKEYLEACYDQLAEDRVELDRRGSVAANQPRLTAEAVGIGKAVEKLAPSLRGFPADPSDCRPLFEPIDYIVFNGLARTGRVESLTFVDVKSGRGRLTPAQAQIRSVVECGKVALLIADHRARVAP